MSAKSNLGNGEVTAEVDLPPGKPEKILLRFRLPDGNKVASAMVNKQSVSIMNDDVINLTGLTGHVTIQAKILK